MNKILLKSLDELNESNKEVLKAMDKVSENIEKCEISFNNWLEANNENTN